MIKILFICHGNILILSNRIALGRQEKKRLAKLYGREREIDKYTDDGLELLTELGNIFIYSYQKLAFFAQNPKSEEAQKIINKKFTFVICDECHFFYNDALFNPYTQICLDFMIKYLRDTIRIYMTATPDEIFGYIIGEEINFLYKNGWPRNVKELPVYQINADYGYIDVVTFQDDKELEEMVQDSGDEKWIIFVTKKEHGKRLLNQFSSRDMKAAFITSDSKKKEQEGHIAYVTLVERQSFEEKVLIATSVIDNGVNIKDKMVKNMVIFEHDQTRFLQMLGRIRVTDGQRIQLYIPRVHKKDVSLHLSQCVRDLRAFDKLMDNPLAFYREYIGQETDMIRIKGMYFWDQQGHVIPNYCFYNKLKLYDLQFWARIKKQMDEGCENAGLAEVCHWLGLTLEDVRSYHSEEKKTAEQELIDYMEASIGRVKKDKFSHEFSRLSVHAYGLRKEDKVRNPEYGLNIMKKVLKEHHLPYSIINKRDGWYIERTD